MINVQQQKNSASAMPVSIAFAFLLSIFAFTSVAVADEVRTSERSQQTYGPVTNQDTIWFIANRIHPDRSVSIYQTIAALVDANPELFPEDTINQLPTGVSLNVPSAQDIRAQDAELARKRMIPLLGGEFAVAEMVNRARVNIDELREQHQEELNAAEQRLEDAQRDLRGVNRENEALRAQILDLEVALETAEAAASAQPEQTARVEREQRREVEVETVYEPSLAWFLGWPGVVIPLAFIGLIFAFLVLALRRNEPRKKATSPYKAATAAHLAEEHDDQAAVEAPERSDSSPEQPQEPVDSYREISDILDEAEANPDADSDFDAGQTSEEAAQSEKEELAAQVDLARAYLEMGELDEAIAALEEVMPIADAELQAEAEQLLEKIKEQK